MKNSQLTLDRPRVSIGMPVYNGERYIREAIESILAQSFRDFELIICDNASTDGTEEICQEYAAKDGRIRYHRNEANIGAGRNFNLAVSLARGEYFKWAAHDDVSHPEFLERSVAKLDSDPGVALVYCKARVIDQDSNPIDSYSGSEETNHEDPVVRFRHLIKPHICFQVFGLMRVSALKDTPLIGLYARGDEILLCWLGMRGRFFQLDDYLFFPRKHEAQSMAMLEDKKKKKKADFIAYSVWFDPKWKNRMVFPWWISLRELIRCVSRAPISLKDRFRCSLYVLRWVASRRYSLARDVLNQLRYLAPRSYSAGSHSAT